MANIPFLTNSSFSGDIYLGTDSDILKSGTNPFRLYTNGTLALSVSASQNATFTGNVLVGSGTIDNPQSWGKILQVQNSGVNGASLSVKDSNNEWNLATYNSKFYISDGVDERLTIDSSGNSTFTGLVSGITPVAAANFVTKAYVDGSGGGTGPFLPLAGGTMTGDLKLNDNIVAKFGTGEDLRIQHAAGGGGVGFIQNYTGNLQIEQHAYDKDILLRCDDGSGGLVSYLVLDGSTTHAYFSNPGNVGIGTTNPTDKLFIRGDNPNIVLYSDTTTGSLINFIDQSWQSQIKGNQGTLVFNTGGTSERMRIATNGNVGIGTSSPAKKLHVSSGDQSTSRIRISNTNTGSGGDDIDLIAGINNVGQDGFSIFNATSNQTQFVIQGGGNVGIGTTSPNDILDIKKANSQLRLTDSDDDKFVQFSYSGGKLITRNNSTSTGVNQTTLTEDGRFGIGTVSPIGKLTVQGDDANIFLRSNDYTIARIINRGSTGTNLDTGLFSLFAPVNTENVRIDAGGASWFNGGNVGIGTTSPDSKLDVTGGSITINTTGTTFAEFKYGAVGSETSRGNIATDGIDLKINATADLLLVPTGNVGIGTTSPTQKLHVDGNALISAEKYYYTAGTGAGFGSDSNGNFKIRQNDADLIFGSGNNVGIGTTNPQALLHITGTVNTNDTKFYLTENTQLLGGFFNYDGNLNINSIGGLDTTERAVISFPRSGNTLSLLTGSSTALKIDSTRSIQFNEYSGTNKTGTPTYLLGTDASGNVVKTNTIPGSGAGPYLPLAGGDMSGATTHGDGVHSYWGNSNDLDIFHDNSFGSIIRDRGAGDFAIETNQAIRFRKSSTTEVMALMVPDGAVSLYYNNVKKFETTSAGATVTGQLTVSNGIEMIAGNFNAGDNERIRLGNSADFQIYHDGSNSFIDNSTGNLTIDSGTHLLLKTATGESLANFFANGANELFYDNSKKLSTGSVSVGTATTAGGTLIDGWKTTTQANAIDDTTIATTAYVNNKIGLIPAGLIFQGTWNAATNTPTLTSGSGTTGNFYIVSTSGSTDLDGVTDWVTGDWAVFIEQGASDQWEKIDNSSVLDGFGTGGSVAGWSGSGTSNTLTNAPITFSGNNSTFAGSAIASNVVINQVTSGTTNGNINIRNNAGSNIAVFHDDLSSTFAGNVGIGRSPDANHPLDIQKDNTSGSFITHRNNTGFALNRTYGDFGNGGVIAEYQERVGVDGNKVSIGTFNAIDFSIRTSNLDRIYIEDSGNVGIGTISPLGKFDVKINGAGFEFYPENSTDTNLILNFDRNASAYQSVQTRAATHQFNIGAAEKMRIHSNGNVGIGTTSPSERLEVTGDIKLSNISNRIKFGTSGTNGSWGAPIMTRIDSRIIISDFNGVQLGGWDGTDYSARMTVLGNGNVGIGTTSPTSPLTIKSNSTSSSSSGLTIQSSGNTNDIFQLGEKSTDGARLQMLDAGVVKIALYSDGSNNYINAGNVGIGTTSPQSKLQVAGGIQMADDTAAPSATKVGTMRYRTGTEYVETTGIELVTNGNFSAGSTGWEAVDTDASNTISFSANKAILVLANTTPITTLRTIAAIAEVNKVYRLIVDIATATSGGIKIDGAGIGALNFNSVGVTTHIIEPTSTTKLGFYRSTANVNIAINSVSLVEVTAEDASYADMCMQTGASTYEWVNIVRNTY